MANSKAENKNVLALGGVSLLTDISSEMVFPLIPIFLTTVLGAPPAILGLIEGIAESAASLLKVASGYVSDKFRKRKPLVLLGYGVSTLTKPLLAFVTSWYGVLVVRFADRLGKGIRTSPRDAIIASSTTRKVRGAAFGLHRTMDAAGAVVGPLLAYLLLTSFDIRQVFLFSVIPGLLSIFLLWLFVREPKFAKLKKKFEFCTSWKCFGGGYKKFLIVASIFALANFSYAFIILRAREVGVALALIPIIYLVYNLFRAALSIPAGKLSDKIGRRNTLAIGYAFFILTCLGFGFSDSPLLMWPLFALYGVFWAFTDGIQRAMVSDISKESVRATALGAYHTVVGLATLPASIIAGLLWDFGGSAMTFSYGAGTGAFALIALFMLVRN